MSEVADEAIIKAVNKLNDHRVNNRQRYNKELLKLLTVIVNEYGNDLRFGQILANFGFVHLLVNRAANGYHYWSDEYNLESSVLFSRVESECTKVFKK